MTNTHSYTSVFVTALAGTLALLAVPLLGMVFTSAVNWTVGDVLVAGGLLFAALSTGLWLIQQATTQAYRVCVLLAVSGLLLLVWGNAAVGLTDTPADRFIWFVPLVAIGSALLARAHSRGLARAMLATWGALASIALLGLSSAGAGGAGVGEVAAVVGFFGLWFGSAAFCFHRAGCR